MSTLDDISTPQAWRGFAIQCFCCLSNQGSRVYMMEPQDVSFGEPWKVFCVTTRCRFWPCHDARLSWRSTGLHRIQREHLMKERLLAGRLVESHKPSPLIFDSTWLCIASLIDTNTASWGICPAWTSRDENLGRVGVEDDISMPRSAARLFWGMRKCREWFRMIIQDLSQFGAWPLTRVSVCDLLRDDLWPHPGISRTGTLKVLVWIHI